MGMNVVAPFERALQKQLAHDPGLLESGLRCVETEYHLTNSEGTRGRIDILARDAHGSWVVIELKRADATATQALHEVTRHTELLRREKGLAPARIRAILASTSWDGLLVPVSNLASGWSHDLRGYQLVLGSDGVLSRAEPVELLPDRATEVGARDLSAANRYTGSARTTDRARWPVLLTEHRRSLHHNADWSALVQRWLDDVGAAPTDSDVLLHVHNPCDLIATLVHGWPDDHDRFTPMLLGIARTASGPHRIIRGTLYWTGRPVPNLAERVRVVYRDPMAWMAADNRSRDALLTGLLELRYVFFEHISDSLTTCGEDDDAAIWAVKDGVPARFTTPFTELRHEGWKGMYALPTFLDEHRGQVDALVDTYRNTLSLSPPGTHRH